MGPASRAAIIKRQKSDDEFKDAVLSEFQWIRGALNKLVGAHALDKESIDERIERVEERLTRVEAP